MYAKPNIEKKSQEAKISEHSSSSFQGTLLNKLWQLEVQRMLQTLKGRWRGYRDGHRDKLCKPSVMQEV